MQFTIFQESRKGSRSLNQDRIAYTYSRDTLLLVVADGMGGHAGGEIAAQIAVRLFIERFQQEATPILKNPLTFLHETMVKAHAALGSYSAQFSMLETPRTTCVACIVQGGHAYWVHVGDSRLYLYRRGALLAHTRDHSKVQYLVDQGIIRAVDVADHPDRNKVYSCLGGMVDPVIDLSNRTLLRDGDILVLCTDGLWGPVPSDEIGSRIPLLFPALPPGGVREGMEWTDTTQRKVVADAFPVTETSIITYKAADTEEQGPRQQKAIGLESSGTYSRSGTRVQNDQELQMTATGTVKEVHHLGLDGALVSAQGTDSGEMTISVPALGQTVPVTRASRYAISPATPAGR